MTPRELAESALRIRGWFDYVTSIDSAEDLNDAAIAGGEEFEKLTGETLEDYANELIDGATHIVHKITKIQSDELCDFETKKLLEKVVMVLEGPIESARWLLSRSNNRARHRLAMQTILGAADELCNDYSDPLFDAAAGFRVMDGDSTPSEGGNSTPSEDGDSSAIWLGGNQYEVDGVACTVAGDSLSCVMEAAVDLGAFCSEDLVGKSGIDHATQILSKFSKSAHPLAKFVHCPGGKGKGGYWVKIKKSNSQTDTL